MCILTWDAPYCVQINGAQQLTNESLRFLPVTETSTLPTTCILRDKLQEPSTVYTGNWSYESVGYMIIISIRTISCFNK